MTDRVERIRELLELRFGPQKLDVEDQSHLHAGHAGAASGRGHFRVRIVAETFEGMLPLRRHRAIYDALGDLMQTEIHALSIEARTPAESARTPFDEA